MKLEFKQRDLESMPEPTAGPYLLITGTPNCKHQIYEVGWVSSCGNHWVDPNGLRVETGSWRVYALARLPDDFPFDKEGVSV